MELSEQKRNLYNGTNNPDYDIDDFSAQMERMVDGQLDELLKIKGNYLHFELLKLMSMVVSRHKNC